MVTPENWYRISPLLSWRALILLWPLKSGLLGVRGRALCRLSVRAEDGEGLLLGVGNEMEALDEKLADHDAALIFAGLAGECRACR